MESSSRSVKVIFSLIYKNFLWLLPCYRYMYSSRFLVLKQKLPSRVKWLKNRSPKCKYLHFSLSLFLLISPLSLSLSLYSFFLNCRLVTYPFLRTAHKDLEKYGYYLLCMDFQYHNYNENVCLFSLYSNEECVELCSDITDTSSSHKYVCLFCFVFNLGFFFLF